MAVPHIEGGENRIKIPLAKKIKRLDRHFHNILKRNAAKITNDKKTIVRSPIDAGCGEKYIAEAMKKYRNKNIKGDPKLLQAHR